MSAQAKWIISRKNIVDKLRAAVLTYPLVVLTAPMGYGKTTIAQELLRCFPGTDTKGTNRGQETLVGKTFMRTYYLPMPSGESSAAYLWERDRAVLTADGSPIADIMHRGTFPFDIAQRTKAFEDTKAFTAKEPNLFVVDDYHFMHASEYEAYLERLIRAAIPGLSILILSRSRPALPLEELRMKGLCTVFDKEILTFTPGETVRFFQACGIQEQGIAEKACEASEGWAAALWLNAQGYLSNGTLATKGELHRLLKHTVFSGYSPEDQRLLLKLSILDNFTPEQAAEISGEKGIEHRLLALCERNAFLHYMPKTNSYRMHSLFHSFCTSLFEVTPDAELDKEELYRRAGEWCLRAKDLAGAIQYLNRAGRDEDLERILELCEQPWSRESITFDYQNMVDICLNIPWRIRRRRPLGHLAFVYSYSMQISRTKGLVMLDEAEEQFVQLAHGLDKRVAGHIAYIRAALSFTDMRKAGELMREARALLQEPVIISSSKLLSTSGSPHLGFLYLRDLGSYAALTADAKQLWQPYLEISNGGGVGSPTLLMAEQALETGNFEIARQNAELAIEKAGQQEHYPVMIAAGFTLCRLYIATKRIKEACAALKNLVEWARSSKQPALSGTADMIQGYGYACLSRSQEIPAWLTSGDVDTDGFKNYGLYFCHIIQGKALLLQNNYVKLVGLTQYMRQVYRNKHFLFGLVHTAILEAVAMWNIFGMEQGIALFKEALELARPDNLMLTLSEYGNEIIPLVKVLLKENPNDSFLQAVHHQTVVYATLEAAHIPTKARATRLTAREKKMLELLTQGKSSKELAAYFSVQRVTVTKALGNVYRKLGVKNRSQAIRIFMTKQQLQ